MVKLMKEIIILIFFSILMMNLFVENVNATESLLIDQSIITGYYSFNVVGQTFTTVTQNDVSKISVYLGASWSETVTINVWESPSKLVLLGTSNLIPIEGWNNFSFITPLPVLSNTSYYFEISSTHDRLIAYSSFNIYLYGSMYNNGEWDLAFRVYSANLPPPLPGVHGIVYHLLNNVALPISGAEVKIYNNVSSFMQTMITGNDGFFSFGNLSKNTTYFISGSERSNYDDSSTYIVTTNNSFESFLQNIYMQLCSSSFTCFQNKQYVTFKLIYPNSSLASGINVKVYKQNGDEENEGYTDATGQIVFFLNKIQTYSFVISDGVTTKVVYLIPSSLNYIITFGTEMKYWNEMSWNLTNTDNSIVFTMQDPNSEILLVYITIGNETNSSLYSYSFSGTNVVIYSPSNLSSEYKVTYKFVSIHFGTTTGISYISFINHKINFSLIPQVILNAVSFIFIIVIGFTGAFHSDKIALVGVAVLTAFFWYIGTLVISSLIVSLLFVIAIVNLLKGN